MGFSKLFVGGWRICIFKEDVTGFGPEIERPYSINS